MNIVKHLFGFLSLGMATYFASRFLDHSVSLLLIYRVKYLFPVAIMNLWHRHSPCYFDCLFQCEDGITKTRFTPHRGFGKVCL